MRFRAKIIVAALVMIPAVLTQTPASASWCAEYSGGGGYENCGFSTFEQCQATVSGRGANFCRPSQYNNPSYASAGVKNDDTSLSQNVPSNARVAAGAFELNPGKLPLFFSLAVSCQQRPIVVPPPIEFYLQKI